ncbi:MAG: FliG C-terminal domain-containing protein [Aestuariivirgaceae bacterium]
MNLVAASSVPSYSRPLGGSEKVAVLLLALETELAGQLLQHFEPDEIDGIRTAADQLAPITAGDLEAIVEEFVRQVSNGLGFVGTPGQMHALLNSALKEEDAEEPEFDTLDADAEETAEPEVWPQVAELPEEVLLEFLQNEHPQTVTVILSNLESESSAKIIAQMSEELRLEVMRRMLALKPVPEEIIECLEKTLRAGLLAQQEDASGSEAHARIANIINRMDGDQRQQLIDSIAEASPDEAAQIKRLLFSFEDIEQLADDARLVLFGQVPTELLVTALHGCGDTLRELALSALSARARRMVEAELARESDSSDDDISEARRKVAAIALDLAGQGEIQLVQPDEE